MARESKAEREVHQALDGQLVPGESLRGFTLGARESSSALLFIFGGIGVALDRLSRPGFIVGLTDKRLILIEVTGNKPTGNVYNIAVEDIRGLEYQRGAYSGTLNIHLSADILKLSFDNRPWYPRAQQMAKLMPLPT